MMQPAAIIVWAIGSPFLALALLASVNTARQLAVHKRQYRLRSEHASPDRLGSLRLFNQQELESLERPRKAWRSKLTPNPWREAGGLSRGELINYANLLKERQMAWGMATECVLFAATAALGAWAGLFYSSFSAKTTDSNLSLNVSGLVLAFVILGTLTIKQWFIPPLRSREIEFRRLRSAADAVSQVPNEVAVGRHLALLQQWSVDGLRR